MPCQFFEMTELVEFSSQIPVELVVFVTKNYKNKVGPVPGYSPPGAPVAKE